MFKGAATAHTCAHPTSNAYTSLGRHCSTTRPSQSSSSGSVHLHFAGNVYASVRASGIDKEGSCSAACAAALMLVGRDRSFRHWSIYQDKRPRWVGPCGSAVASMGQQSLSPAEVWKYGRSDVECRLPCSSKIVQDGNRRFGTQRHDHVPNMSQWSQHRSGAGVQSSAKGATTRSEECFQLYRKIRHEESLGGRLPLSSAPTPRQAGLAQRAEVLLTRQLQVWRLTTA